MRWAPPFAPQVARDYLPSARLAIDSKDEAAIDEERASWVDQAKKFWAQLDDGDDQPHSNGKFKRVKAYSFLYTMEHLLRVCAGLGGLLDFQIVQDAPRGGSGNPQACIAYRMSQRIALLSVH